MRNVYLKGVCLRICGSSALGCKDDGYQERKKFCWILFIYTKCMLNDFPRTCSDDIKSAILSDQMHSCGAIGERRLDGLQCIWKHTTI